MNLSEPYRLIVFLVGILAFVGLNAAYLVWVERKGAARFQRRPGPTEAGYAGLGPYCASRGGVRQLTMSLADDWGVHGITVNCLCPGITDHTGVWSHVSAGYIQNLNLPREEVVKKFTGKIPLKRLAKIDDLVAVTLFLSSPGADYMTGQAINVTGGQLMEL